MSVETKRRASYPARGPASTALIAFITRLHFYIGLFVGPFILVAAVTGTLYVLTPQIEASLYAEQLTTESTGASHPLEDQITAASVFISKDATLFAVRPAPREGATTRIMFSQPGLGESESRAIFVDPVTLDIKGDLTTYGTSGILPFRIMLDYLHRNLLLGDLGRNYSELAASWLWIAALSGFVLWLLGSRHSQASARRNSRLRLRRLHSLTGLWIGLGLLFFSATGLTWSKWAGERIDVVRSTMGWVTPSVSLQLDTSTITTTPAGGAHAEHSAALDQAGTGMDLAAPAMFDRMLSVAREAGIDAGMLEIRPAKTADTAWLVREVDRSWPTQVDTIAIDPHSLQVTSRADFAEFPLIAKLIRWGIDAHMGILFGLLNQLLLAAFGVALSVMILLGYIMWWRRRPAPATTAPLAQAWQRLNTAQRATTLVLAGALGWSLPLIGASLLLFVLLDIARWKLASQRQPDNAGA